MLFVTMYDTNRLRDLKFKHNLLIMAKIVKNSEIKINNIY